MRGVVQVLAIAGPSTEAFAAGSELHHLTDLKVVLIPAERHASLHASLTSPGLVFISHPWTDRSFPVMVGPRQLLR